MAGSSVVYVTGAHHSGTTLVDVLLGGHPEVSGLGEVFRLSMPPSERVRSFGNRCGCGRQLGDCPYWRRLSAALAARLDVHDGDVFERHPITVWPAPPEVESNPLRRSRDLVLAAATPGVLRLLSRIAPPPADLTLAARNSWQLYDVVAQVDGARWVVDSSKSVIRLKALHLTRPDSCRIIYVTRDGRAVAASDKRREGTRIEEGSRYWKRQVKKIELALRSLPREQQLTVRYEDLCADPPTVLARICRFLDLSFDAAMLRWDDRELHQVPGNPMLASGVGQIVADERWRKDLDARDLASFEQVAGRLNRRLGYL